MPRYNLIEYSDNCSEISGILWKCCRDVPAVDNDGEVTDFTKAYSFNLKERLCCSGY